MIPSGPTVLVVEDDPSMRDLLHLHLTNAGYRVLMAEDAIVAGHMLMKLQPDLMLLDVDMPFMTGIEFLQALQADATVARFPVVFLTASPEARSSAKILGAVGYIPKNII